MKTLRRNKPKIISIIREYQQYLKLNLQFIRELEAEGADASELWKDVREIERKITELRLQV